MKEDRTIPQSKILIGARLSLEALGMGACRGRLGVTSKETVHKWEAFKSELAKVLGKRVPVRVKGRAG